MPEGNGEAEIHESRLFKQIVHGEFGDETILLDCFDMDKETLYVQLDVTAELLGEDPETDGIATIDCSVHAENFRELIRYTLDKDGDMNDSLHKVIDIMKVDSDTRFDRMNKVLLDDVFDQTPPETFANVILKIANNATTHIQLIDDLVSYYRNDLEVDVSNFMQVLYQQYGRDYEPDAVVVVGTTVEDEIPVVSIVSESEAGVTGKKEVKAHLLDVAKIATGVFFAITLDRKLRGRD